MQRNVTTCKVTSFILSIKVNKWKTKSGRTSSTNYNELLNNYEKSIGS